MTISSQQSPFILGFDGIALRKDLRKHLREINPAGLILFRRNMESLKQTRQLIHELRDFLGEIIIAVDHEGGIVNRFPEDCPVPPSPSALHAARSQETIEKACRLQAEVLAYLGFNMNFVPLVDLALSSENQVIGTRAFSSDPEEVSAYSERCILEHRKLGIGTTAKHFPTHGRSSDDSHFTTGSVYHATPDQLDQDLLPYKKTIEFGVPAVMTAHLTYPQLDEQYPASLSRVILQGLLREKLNFPGLIISDCVEMAGISQVYSPQTIVDLGMSSGVDLFISSYSLKKSWAFQTELNRWFRRLEAEADPLVNESLQRRGLFLKHYPGALRGTYGLPPLESAIELHQQTLDKRRSAPVPVGYGRFHLVELSNNERQGVNLDSGWNSVSKEVLKECEHIAGNDLLCSSESQRLAEIVAWCNQKGMTCVLLSANGYRQQGYEEFVHRLQPAISAIHIGLMEPHDLKQTCSNEWVTYGFNACTGKMLSRELNRLV